MYILAATVSNDNCVISIIWLCGIYSSKCISRIAKFKIKWRCGKFIFLFALVDFTVIYFKNNFTNKNVWLKFTLLFRLITNLRQIIYTYKTWYPTESISIMEQYSLENIYLKLADIFKS